MMYKAVLRNDARNIWAANGIGEQNLIYTNQGDRHVTSSHNLMVWISGVITDGAIGESPMVK